MQHWYFLKKKHQKHTLKKGKGECSRWMKSAVNGQRGRQVAALLDWPSHLPRGPAHCRSKQRARRPRPWKPGARRRWGTWTAGTGACWDGAASCWMPGGEKKHRAVFSRDQIKTHTEPYINFITVAFAIKVKKQFSLQKAAKFD